MTSQVDGHRHGDRVRDKRDGSTGTVHIIELTDPEEIAEVGYRTITEVRWDNSAVHCEIDVVLPYITRL